MSTEITSDVRYTAITYLIGNVLVVCLGSALASVSIQYAFSDRTLLKTTMRIGSALLSIHVVLAFIDTM